MMGAIGSVTSGLGTAGMWAPLLFGAALLALLARTLVGALRREERPVPVRTITAEDVLRERLARGEISEHEFEDALRVLRDS